MISLRGMGLKILGGLTAALGFLALLFRSQRDRERMKRERQNRINAEAREKSLLRANTALDEGQREEQEDVNEARQKAARGDFDDFSDPDY